MTYNITYKHRDGDFHWEIENRLEAFYLQRYLCRGSIRNPYLWLALLVSQVVYWSVLASTGSMIFAFIIYTSAFWWMLTHATDAWAGDIIERMDSDNHERNS
jgi:hypothetical protein